MKRRWFPSALSLVALTAAATSIVVPAQENSSTKTQSQQQQQSTPSNTTGGGWRRAQESDTPRTPLSTAALSPRAIDDAAVPGGVPVDDPGPAPAPAPQQQASNRVAIPGEITIPAGTWITVRTDQLLSSDYNRQGDAFAATLSQPIIADGIVVARRGQTITGRVTQAIRAGRVKGTSRLGIELSEISTADGQQIPIRSQLVEFSAGQSRGQDTAVIGTTTGVGAAIGAAASGGFGAGMGAIAGAGASAIGVLLSRGRVTEVPPESVMRFRLLEPVTVNTSRAAHAFQTVKQEDFESRPLQQRVQVRQAPTLWGGGWGGPYYNPWFWGPSYGWGGWGWGPSFYSNRIWIGGGGHYRGGGGRRR